MFEWFAGAMWTVMAVRIAPVAIWRVQATTLAAFMSKLRQGFVPVAVTLILGFASVSVEARALPGSSASGSSEPAPRGAFAMAHDGITLDEAVSRAERQYKARVVRAEVQDEDGRKVYVLKLYKSEDGLVFTVRIDAATGRMR